MDYDLIVIGGGAGGMSAARAGVRRKARTLLVQLGPLGGECTFAGCVPSKTLIAAAAAGIGFPDAMSAVHQTIDTIAATETDEVFTREGIDVVHGWATFRGAREIIVDGRRITGRRFIVATGSRPVTPAVDGLDDVEYLTNENIFGLDHLPRTFVVLGGGAIGCELAQAFSHLGAHVTIVEALDRLVPSEEPEASAVIADAFAAERIDVRLGRRVIRAQALESKGAVRLHLDSGETLTADRLLVAVGRRGCIEGLGLDAAGVATDRGFIVTDPRLATTTPGIWAVGDVAGKLQFTHVADEMGRIAAANAFSPRWRHRRFHSSWIPRVTFTTPELARVGVTEAEAAAHGARVAELPMTEVDRAVITGQTRGFIKLIAGPRPGLRNFAGGQIVGATILASRAGELIHEPALAMRTHMFPARLALTTHAYPTWSTAVQQAAAQFFVEIHGHLARPARSTQHSRHADDSA